MDDVYRLPEEHRELQQAVRGLAMDKIAPRAAEIDERVSSPGMSMRRWRPADSTRSTYPRSTAAAVATTWPPAS